MRTRYRIDDFQQTYFVIDNFQQLFDATRPDFAPIYREIAAQPDIEPDALIGSDRKFDRASWGRPNVGKKMGRKLSAAQV
jgi:phenylalanine-4-hydroxylase